VRLPSLLSSGEWRHFLFVVQRSLAARDMSKYRDPREVVFAQGFVAWVLVAALVVVIVAELIT
jgi:hypothetical protein